MSVVKSRQNKGAAGAKKSRRPRSAPKAAKGKSDAAAVKVVQAPVPAIPAEAGLASTGRVILDCERGRSVQADRVIGRLESALAGGADASLVKRLAVAMQAWSCAPEVAEVVEELAELLDEPRHAEAVEALAQDLERGADPDLIGALAGYLKAGFTTAQVGALAWFFPRGQVIRQGR